MAEMEFASRLDKRIEATASGHEVSVDLGDLRLTLTQDEAQALIETVRFALEEQARRRERWRRLANENAPVAAGAR